MLRAVRVDSAWAAGLRAADAGLRAIEVEVAVVHLSRTAVLLVHRLVVTRLDQPAEAVHAPSRLLERVEGVEHLLVALRRVERRSREQRERLVRDRVRVRVRGRVRVRVRVC